MCVCRFSRSVASNYMRERDRKTTKTSREWQQLEEPSSSSSRCCLSLFTAVTLCNQRLDQQTDRQKRKEELRYVFFWKDTPLRLSHDSIQFSRGFVHQRFYSLIDHLDIEKNVFVCCSLFFFSYLLSIRMLSSVIIELTTGNMIRRRTERKIHTVRDNISNSCCRV